MRQKPEISAAVGIAAEGLEAVSMILQEEWTERRKAREGTRFGWSISSPCMMEVALPKAPALEVQAPRVDWTAPAVRGILEKLYQFAASAGLLQLQPQDSNLQPTRYTSSRSNRA